MDHDGRGKWEVVGRAPPAGAMAAAEGGGGGVRACGGGHASFERWEVVVAAGAPTVEAAATLGGVGGGTRAGGEGHGGCGIGDRGWEVGVDRDVGEGNEFF